MATQATPAMPIQRIQCDPQRLAAAVVAQLQLPYVSLGQPHQQQQQQAQARILDRGAFASIYLLSTSLPRIPKSLVVRVSTRPVYNPTARKQEKDKIRGYVGILLLIHARAPSSVRTLTPRMLAYDASETCEFGHGWIAMTRLPGRPLSESWPELSPAQREVVIRQLATFTNHLSSVGTSSEGDEDGEAAPGSWPAVGSLLVRGDCQTFSPLEAMNDRTLHLDLELAPLLLPKRHGANNLRPVTLEPQHTILTTSSPILLDGDEDEDDYLSCYEVMLPIPSPPSSRHRTQFFPTGSAEPESPTSAVVKSCEDWLAGIKTGMPDIVIFEVEESSMEDLQQVGSVPGERDVDSVYASLALWDTPSASDPSEETPYSTPMSTMLQLDEESDSPTEDLFAFASTPVLSPVATQTPAPPPLLTLSLSGLGTSRRSTLAPAPPPPSANTVQVTRTPATYLPSTTLEMFHTALGAELAFLEEHQPAAARCFNNNMLRLTQCGMADEIPRGARPAVGKWDGYSAQLNALKAIVREVADLHQRQDEYLVLSRVGWDAADVLIQVEEDEVGEEQVRVTGVVDWEFAGVVPRWMVAGLPDFLRSSSSMDDDDDGDIAEREGDGILPLWEEASNTWALPQSVWNDDHLASIWRDTLSMAGTEPQWEKDELVRAAWKVANVEWHEVQKGCAWARGYLTLRSHHYHHHHRHSHPSTSVAGKLNTPNERYLAVDIPSDGECSSGGRSRGTNDTQETVESAMPATPTEDEIPLPTAAAPIKSGQGLGFAGFLFSGGYSDEDGDEGDGSDEEESEEEEAEEEKEDYESTPGSHDWRDEFESAFMFSTPLPSNTLRASSALLQPASSPTAQQKKKKMAEERKREKQKFEQGMNNPLPRVGYEILWEVPPSPTTEDLDFLVERDLDAGW